MNPLNEFFRAEYQRMVRYVRSRVSDAAERDAEDIVMDVMVKLFDQHDVARPIEFLSAYIYRSLRNRIVDTIRGRKKHETLRSLLPDPAPDGSQKLEEEEMKRRLLDAIDSLTPDQKAVLIATEFEGRTYRELSEEWRIPMGTLLARKSRAIKKIRRGLVDSVSWSQGEKNVT